MFLSAESEDRIHNFPFQTTRRCRLITLNCCFIHVAKLMVLSDWDMSVAALRSKSTLPISLKSTTWRSSRHLSTPLNKRFYSQPVRYVKHQDVTKDGTRYLGIDQTIPGSVVDEKLRINEPIDRILCSEIDVDNNHSTTFLLETFSEIELLRTIRGIPQTRRDVNQCGSFLYLLFLIMVRFRLDWTRCL